MLSHRQMSEYQVPMARRFKNLLFPEGGRQLSRFALKKN